ncbi:MAG: NAD-dependent epimerase/dehydratase family protein [Chloroflexota bacterium]|nr:NAD-dependent epimerase/dehydratase family protein [Chloroflexota bacterium]
MSRVLVTGGAGFIGSHTVDLLLSRGYDVRILDSLQPRVHPRGKPDYVPSDVEFILGDVADRADLGRALDNMDFVLHLAAYQDYLPDFSSFIHTNTESTALIFELAVSNPSRYPLRKVVVASSQSVAGEGTYRCLQESVVFCPDPRSPEQLERGQWDLTCPTCGAGAEPLLIDEATCVKPGTAYGISKHALEQLAFTLGRRYDIETAAMRYTYVQGARNSFYNAYSGIARRFALRVRAGLPPVCYEDGRQRRDYVNVLDVARANLVALENPMANGLALNVGGGRAVTALEFAEIVLRASGSDLESSVPGEYRVGDTRHTVSDLTRMRSLGWEPHTPVEENVRQYLEWLDTQAGSDEYLLEAERVMREMGVIRQAVVPRGEPMMPDDHPGAHG